MSASVLWKRLPNAAAATGSGVSDEFDFGPCSHGRLDVNVATIAGGTVESLGGDGPWYAVAAPAALTATGQVSVHMGPGTANTAVLGGRGRVRLTFAGTAPATSIAFSGSFTGRF